MVSNNRLIIMNKISLAIEECVRDCKESGDGYIELNDKENTIIMAEWEELEEWESENDESDCMYDVITVYIKQNHVIKFKYQLEETKVWGERDCTGV